MLDMGAQGAIFIVFGVIVIGALVAAVLTRRRRAEAKRRQFADRLGQGSRVESVGQLTGEIAHDFNNVLMVLQLNLDLALKAAEADPPDLDRLVERLSEANDATQRATALTGHLAAFRNRRSQPEAPVDLGDLLSRLEPLWPMLVGSAINVRMSISGSGLTVYGYEPQLEQVVWNLVINARDAMPNGGDLTIDLLPVTGDPGLNGAPSLIRLMVKDSGSGIAADELDKIFEPLFTTKPTGLATGLGLTTVQNVIRDGGGSVRVDSQVGVGTSFIVELPEAVPHSRPTNGSTPNALH